MRVPGLIRQRRLSRVHDAAPERNPPTLTPAGTTAARTRLSTLFVIPHAKLIFEGRLAIFPIGYSHNERTSGIEKSAPGRAGHLVTTLPGKSVHVPTVGLHNTSTYECAFDLGRNNILFSERAILSTEMGLRLRKLWAASYFMAIL